MVRAPAARSLKSVTDRSNALLGGSLPCRTDTRELKLSLLFCTCPCLVKSVCNYVPVEIAVEQVEGVLFLGTANCESRWHSQLRSPNQVLRVPGRSMPTIERR